MIRYIKGTVDARLHLATPNSNPTGYLDSPWLDNPMDRRSTYGLAILWNGSPLLWKSKRHSMITMSTCESEYLVGTELIRDLSWIRNILIRFNLSLPLPITLESIRVGVSYTSTYLFDCKTDFASNNLLHKHLFTHGYNKGVTL